MDHTTHSRGGRAPRAATLIAAAMLALVLSACGGGASTETLPDSGGTDSANTYTGPAPATADVQAFKANLWENIRSTQRCGACHGAGGQSPAFANNSNVNDAYGAANSVVNLSDPGSSRMVNKVAGGHNCWVANAQFCADQIEGWIADWAGGSGSSGNVVELDDPADLREPGQSKVLTDADQSLFQQYLHTPILTQHCAECHAEGAATPQSPFFATADVGTAFNEVQGKINLDDPAGSRLVVRLRDEFHNCWPNDTGDSRTDCEYSADEMEAGIQAIADSIQASGISPSLVNSKAQTLDEGIVASSGGRIEDDVIALYQFKTGSGATAYDSSGVSPDLHLTLSGNYQWVGGWGIRLNSGRAQGSTTASRKLTQLIQATGEYSIEAWVAPGNVTQEGPARIVSYSGSNTARNFMLGQTLYNYDFQTRSSETDGDGQPALSTADDDEVLQATLQHVVATFTPAEGRRIYVNGELVAQDSTGGSLADWNDTFALVLGNEVSGERQWTGTLRLVAIHNRALSQEEIQTNYDAGVGEKFYLLFGVGGVGGLPDRTYVLLQMSQFDSYSYLVEGPHLVNLDGADLSGTVVRGMRIGINGHEPDVGQAYANLDVSVGMDVTADGPLGAPLSRLGTVIASENGPDTDEFFLTFEKLGSASNVYTDDSQPRPLGDSTDSEYATVGLRTFEEISASMSRLTGVPTTNTAVAEAYERLKQQLPSAENVAGFLSAQQVGVAQLGMTYCNAMVDDATLRSNLFPAFDFTQPSNLAFDTQNERDQIIDPLLDRMMGTTSLTTQPSRASVHDHLDTLINETRDCTDTGGDPIAGCAMDAQRTRSVTKAACAAMLGSATLLLQ
ncbi:MAG: LamG domain-containing protein [Ectothiorhodospiraceae bacterium]|jgi:hypothetical protein